MGLGCTVLNMCVFELGLELKLSNLQLNGLVVRIDQCSHFDKFSNCTLNIRLLNTKKVNVQGQVTRTLIIFFCNTWEKYVLSCRSCTELPLTDYIHIYVYVYIYINCKYFAE